MTDAPGAVPALTVAGIALGAALVPLNSTMIAVALPRIADDFDIATGHVGILVTVYLVAMLVGQPVAGQVADRVGRRRTATAALLGFGACSAAALLPTGFAGLVAARGGQAVFAAALAPSVQAMLRVLTPASQRGRAFGLLGSVIGVGAAGGPVIGGVLIAAFGWQAIFAVNLPIVVLVLVVLHRAVPPDPIRLPGSTRGSGRGGLRSLGNRVYVAAFATQALSVMAQYSLLLVAPIVLDARGWGSGAIGLALSALTIGMIVTGPLGGRIGDQVGRRAPVVAGLTIALVGLGLTVPAGDAVASAVLIASLAVFGIGHGLATPGIMTAGLESVPEEVTGTAAGLLSTSRYAGSIVSSLLLAALVGDAASGAGTLLAVSAMFLAASVLVAFQLPGRAVEHRPVAVRR